MSCGKKIKSIHRAKGCNPAAYFQTIVEKRKMYAVEIVSTWVGIYTEWNWVEWWKHAAVMEGDVGLHT